MNFVSALAAVVLAQHGREHACAGYYPEPVELSGTLTVRIFFGPPNYGLNPKTDAKERQTILKLDQPLCVSASADEPAESGQKEVTLVPPVTSSLAASVGKHVIVSGTLFHAITAHHHTPVLMTLTEMPRQWRP